MMIHRPAISTLVVALLTGVGLMAQGAPKSGDLNFNVNLHAGGSLGNLKDDLHAQNVFGIGLEGSYALSSTSAIIGEVTFTSYGGGKGYDNTKLSGPIYTTGPSSTSGGVPLNLAIKSSVDYRKNSLAGFSLRGGYRSNVTDIWSWQAGLTLDSLKYRQEASGTLQPLAAGVPVGPYEGFAVTPTETKLNLGAFAGVRAQVNDNISLEANVLSVGYGTANYQPFTYTGQAPAVSSETRHGFVIELALGFKM
jgi:hypothetical protein